jgi:hypothetical protein
LLEHTILPASVATTAALLAALGCVIGGSDPATALVAVAVAPLLTACAAMSARREGRLPPSLLVNATAADPSGGAGALLAWLGFWPALAGTFGAAPVALAANGAAALALILVVLATAGLARLVARDVT